MNDSEQHTSGFDSETQFAEARTDHVEQELESGLKLLFLINSGEMRLLQQSIGYGA